MAVQIQFRRGSAASWVSANTVLAAGELGLETDTTYFKIGDGTTAWNSLSYSQYNGTLADINNITNVAITSASSGQVLQWNGSAWVNGTVDISAKADIASPTFTGTPLAPTADTLANNTQIATTEFVQTVVTNLVDSAPATLNTLNELAAALGDDANFATTTSTALGLKAPLADPTFTGTVTLPNNTITANAIATDAVTTAKIADNAVTSVKLASAIDGLSSIQAANANVSTQLRVTTVVENAAVSAVAASGTVAIDYLSNPTIYYTSNASGNWTINVRANSTLTMDSVMSTGDVATVTMLATQGSPAYFANVIQVDGSTVTPKWQGGTAPTSGNASSIDGYTLTVVKTGTGTFTVFASQTKFA